MFSSGLVAALALGLMAAVSLSDQPTTVDLGLQSGGSVVTVGKPFQIVVAVDAKEPINAVEMDLLYEEKFLEIEQIRDGESVLTIWAEEPTASGGVVHFRGGTFRRGFVGEHKLITMTARATKSGTFRIHPQRVLLLAGDGDGTKIELSAKDVTPLTLTARSQEAAMVDDAVKSIWHDTDISGDGRVTMRDISIFMSAWGKTEIIYDFTGDNRMTFPDFSVILTHYFLGK
jgi:hypothetical protein